MPTNITAFLAKLEDARAFEDENMRGFNDMLSLNTLTEELLNVIMHLADLSSARLDLLVATIAILVELQTNGYPNPVVTPITQAQKDLLNAQINTELSTINLTMSRL
jgi:hypothetical protein